MCLLHVLSMKCFYRQNLTQAYLARLPPISLLPKIHTSSYRTKPLSAFVYSDLCLEYFYLLVYSDHPNPPHYSTPICTVYHLNTACIIVYITMCTSLSLSSTNLRVKPESLVWDRCPVKLPVKNMKQTVFMYFFCTYRFPPLSYVFLEDFVTLTALRLEQMLTMQRCCVKLYIKLNHNVDDLSVRNKHKNRHNVI